MAPAELSFLIVEDHDFRHSTLLRALARLGATQVQTTTNGPEALEILATADPPIDVIVADLDLAGLTGLEFMRGQHARATPPSVILASALESVLTDAAATLTDAFGTAILGVIEKPVTAERLAQLIARYPLAPAPAKRAAEAPATFSLPDIRAGLERNEFEPFFQPKVELGTGRITGAEALARWRHPELGVLPPAAFLGPLEQASEMDELTWVMLRAAAAFCGEWRRSTGLDVNVAVNLSIISLAEQTLADRVTRLVRAEHLDPRHMVLEVTEAATTVNPGYARENLERLRLTGFGLSIDDYGTGYSSVQQLSAVPYTEIKIDRAFVTNASKQASVRVMLESGLDVARRLHLASVAEGIESQSDWDFVRGLGCQAAQGYFIAKPMDAAAFLAWNSSRLAADRALSRGSLRGQARRQGLEHATR